ncbi:MAG: hypothetical protein K0Q83_1177 [Deltaproteobacteria bacterium]|jgi:hypothetical protein|nr:hypothetical protein [Deltaproteobacteria bacterium]
MNNDREAETKAQKPKPMTIDKSQPFMSTISPPLGLASAAPLTGCQRKAGCRRAARARLIAQGIRVDQGRRDRHDKAAESIELSFISRTNSVDCDMICAAMAVLHITYKHNPQTSRADYDGFYQVITSYRWARLSDSIWAITADEPPKAVWKKLKRYIDPDDYLVMLTFKSSSWNLKDQKVLAWLLERPAD